MEFILQPWPWYVSGPLIAVVMIALIYFGKTFGMSGNLRTFCTIGGADRFAPFFKFDWKSEIWNLTVVLGAVIGGFIAVQYLSDGSVIDLNPKTVENLSGLGFDDAGAALLPPELYNWSSALTLKGLLILVGGGFLVGFGTRYAGGCTSGHAITGLSNLQWPSLVAVIGFFIGGLVMNHFLYPLIFGS